MYDLTEIGLIKGGVHLALSWFAVEVAHLTCVQYLALITFVALLDSLVVDTMFDNWKSRVASKLHSPNKRAISLDEFGFTVTLLAAGFATNRIVRSHYGWSGFWGAIAIHVVISALFP